MDSIKWDRSSSEPAGLSFVNNGKHSEAASDAQFNVQEVKLRNFYADFKKSRHNSLSDDSTLTKWCKVNGLNRSLLTGEFRCSKAEHAFAQSQSLYTDTSVGVFLSVFLAGLTISFCIDAIRVGSIFDPGLPSRTLRLVLGTTYGASVLGFLSKRRTNERIFVDMQETTRFVLAGLFSNFWFIYFPQVHSTLLRIPINPQIRYDTMVIWSLVLLQLTSLSACAAFKLRQRHALFICAVAATEGLVLMSRTNTIFVWNTPEGIALLFAMILCNLIVLRHFDSQSRAQFVLDAHRYEISERVVNMARRLRAAQAFANASWKADNTVVALKRIRDDKTLAFEKTLRSVLDIGISSFGFNLETTTAPATWKGSRTAIERELQMGSPWIPGQRLRSLSSATSTSTTTQSSDEWRVLRPMLADWNFGASAGIWSHLEDPRFPQFASRPLVTIMTNLIYRLTRGSNGLAVDRETLGNYFQAVEDAYLPRDQVTYHNVLHAADVVQTVYAMVHLDAASIGKLSDLAIFALYFSAAIHDVGHPGVNNAHLISSGHEMALTYNDKSVLENYHLSRAFAIMASGDEYDILKNLAADDRENGTQTCRMFRNLVIDMVLATDLSHHPENQARFRALLADSIDFSNSSHVSTVCSMLLHAADVANVAKAWNAYEPWIDLLFQEFFLQGDKEKELGFAVAPFMDRSMSIPERAQCAFITNLVMPMFTLMSEITPKVAEKAIYHMNDNLQKLDRKAKLKEHERGRSSSVGSLETIISRQDDEGTAESDATS